MNDTRESQRLWMVNYDIDRALANYHYIAAMMNSPATGRWPRIFASRDCAAIVICADELDTVPEPHVMAWRDSFDEFDREEFLRRTSEWLQGKRSYLGEVLSVAA